jgi:hypothetical protein
MNEERLEHSRESRECGRADFLCLQGCSDPLHRSEREGGRERDLEYGYFYFKKGMTGTLARFSYLVLK